LLARTNDNQTLVDTGAKTFPADKLVALDRDKAEFCYALCRSLGARQVVEAGTSHGVSTLYLAAAVRDTCAVSGDYRDYFEFIRAPDNGFRTMTLPFDGGFEFSVKCG